MARANNAVSCDSDWRRLVALALERSIFTFTGELEDAPLITDPADPADWRDAPNALANEDAKLPAVDLFAPGLKPPML